MVVTSSRLAEDVEWIRFDTMRDKFAAFVRIMMGWVFFWPFLDKTFGLGYATESGSGWIDGGSPTYGFLQFGTSGPFQEFFQGMADSVLVEWLFMIGLLGIGLAFLLGMGVRIAGYSAALMLFLMWLAVLPIVHNPFLDDHLVYAVICVGLTFTPCGDTWGLGKWWKSQEFVQNNKFLI